MTRKLGKETKKEEEREREREKECVACASRKLSNRSYKINRVRGRREIK